MPKLILITIAEVFFLIVISNSGCLSAHRYLFIDLGTNDGSSIDAFLPAASSSDNKKDKNIAHDGSFAAANGNNDSFFFTLAANKSDPRYNKANYEIYAVEANPNYSARLLKQKKRYEDSLISKSYTLYNGTGISTQNGFGHIILDCPG